MCKRFPCWSLRFTGTVHGPLQLFGQTEAALWRGVLAAKAYGVGLRAVCCGAFNRLSGGVIFSENSHSWDPRMTFQRSRDGRRTFKPSDTPVFHDA